MYQIYADDLRLWVSGTEDLELYNVTLETELNKAGSLKFTMPSHHILYDELTKLKNTIYVKFNDKIVWSGRILNDTKGYYNQKEVYCEGALSFLMDSLAAPVDSDNKYTATVQEYFNELINNHNSQVDTNRQFIVGNCDVEGSVEVERSSYTETFNELQSALLDEFEGYIKIEYSQNGAMTIHYLKDYGEKSAQNIEYGINLLDLEDQVDAANLCTILIATGKTNDGQDEISYTYTNESAVELYGKIYRHEDFGDVTSQSELESLAKKYFTDGNGQVVNTFNLKAADFSFIEGGDNIELGDLVHVVSKPHGIDTHYICRSISLPLENPGAAEYTLGDTQEGLTDQGLRTRRMADNATITAKVNAAETKATQRASSQFYFSNDRMMVAPEDNYVGHPVKNLTSAEQAAIVYTIYSEVGVGSGDLGSCIIVAQCLRDTFDYYNHATDGAGITIPSWYHIISFHCYPDYWTYGVGINVADPTYDTAYKAFKYVFVEGNSAVKHRIFAWMGSSLVAADGWYIVMDNWPTYQGTPIVGAYSYIWSTDLFDTNGVWFVNSNSEVYSSKTASITAQEISDITGRLTSSGSLSDPEVISDELSTQDLDESDPSDTVPDTNKYLDKVGLEQIFSSDGAIGSIKSQVNEMQTDVTTTKNKVNSMEDDVNTALSNAATALESIEGIENELETVEDDIDNIETNYAQKANTIKSQTIHYLATSASSGVTTSTYGWTTTVQSITSTNKYLWTYITYTFGNNTTSNTTPVITGVYGNKGDQGDPGQGTAGVGVSSVTPLYYSSSSSSAPSAPTSAVTSTSTSSGLWTKAIPTISSTYPYLYTCMQTYYTNSTYKWSTVVKNNAISGLATRMTAAETNITNITNKATSTFTVKAGSSGTGGIKSDGTTLYLMLTDTSYGARLFRASSTAKAGAFEPITTAAGGYDDTTVGMYLGRSAYKWKCLFAYTSTIQTSDRNYKKDITYDMSRYLEMFDDLNPTPYKFIAPTSDRVHLGYIAQDVEASMNEHNISALEFGGLCKDLNEETGQYDYGLRYGEFVPLNTAAIKRAENRIDELKAEVEELKALVNQLLQGR